MPHSKPSSLRPPAKLFLYEFEAIGTKWKIELFEPLNDKQAASLKQAISERIELFDKDYSRFRHDSLVFEMAHKAGSYTLPADAQPLLDFYWQLYKLTNRAVTPLIGQTLSDAGYDANYSLKSGDVTAPLSWEKVLDYQFPTLTLKQPALLDFGAAGKGYLADIISELLTAHNIVNYCVDAGGDIVYHTATPQQLEVALEHPADPTQAIGIASLHNQSLCGSAGNRRTWTTGNQTYHHILDPRKLTSPDHIQAIWVVANSGLVADGLTTALFFVKPEELAKLHKTYGFEYAIIYKDLSLQHSTGFPATFF